MRICTKNIFIDVSFYKVFKFATSVVDQS